MAISTCRLTVLPSILYHASLNSRACFVCARPNSSVSVQLKVRQLSYVCASGIVIYNRIVLWRFCVQLFVFQFSSRVDLCIVVDSLGKVSCMYIAFFVCFDVVLTLCFVKYDLSLCAGLCATSMLKGRNNLSVFSDVLFM